MTQNKMLMTLSQIWASCVLNYPGADHEEILKRVNALQMLIFELGGE